MTVLRDRFFGRLLSHEGGTPMNRISALIQENPERSLAYTTHEDTTRSLQPRPGPSGNHACTKNSDLQPPKLRNQFLLLKSPVCGTLYRVIGHKWKVMLHGRQGIPQGGLNRRNFFLTLITISHIVFGLIIKYYIRSPLVPERSKARRIYSSQH